MNLHPIQLNGHQKLITCLSYIEKINRIISASDDCNLRVWDISQMACVQVLQKHSKGVITILDLPKKCMFITGGKDKCIKIFSYSFPKNIQCVKSLHQAHDSILLSLSYNHNSELLISTGFDKYIKFYDIYEGTVKKSLKNDCSIYCTQVLNKKRIAAGCHIPKIIIYSANLEVVSTLIGHTHSIFCLLYLKKNKILVSGSLDNTIILWNYQKGIALRVLKKHNRSVLQLINFPDKNLIGSFGYDNTLRLWDYKRGKNVKSILQTKFKREATHSLIYHYYASFVYVPKEKKFFFNYFDDNIKVRDSKVVDYE